MTLCCNDRSSIFHKQHCFIPIQISKTTNQRWIFIFECSIAVIEHWIVLFEIYIATFAVYAVNAGL